MTRGDVYFYGLVALATATYAVSWVLGDVPAWQTALFGFISGFAALRTIVVVTDRRHGPP